MQAPRSYRDLQERLLIQQSDRLTIAVSSLTRSGTVATATTPVAHGYATHDYVTVAGAGEAAYTGKVKITVTGLTTFTYAVAGSPASPATNAITVVYSSDAQGGRVPVWRDLATVWAEMIALSAHERLQLAAIQSDVAYRFRIRTRIDLTPAMRARWTPRWPPRAPEHVLAITGLLPDEGGRVYQLLECSESAAA